MNCYVFSGNLGKDCEQRVTQGGTEICQFSVAVTSGYGDRKKTNWVKCSLFGRRGQSLAPYLNKGQQVVVSGELSLNEWQKDSGETVTTLEVNVNDVTLVGGKSQGAQQQSAPADTATPAGGMDDNIPFSPLSSSIY